MLPAVPDPTTASIDALHDVCFAVREWVDGCDDIAEATEALARVSAVETYLSRRGAEGPAQEAARWVEVRIGELLGPASETNGRPLHRDAKVLTEHERHWFRCLAEHRDLVAAKVPCSRSVVLKAIKQATAAVKLTAEPAAVGVVYPTIVIDPPWRYDNVATRGAAEDHYPTMSMAELEALELPAAVDAHLYLWVTNGFLREGFTLLDAWGFTYKTCLTWIKPQIGMGNWFRNATEHVLFAVKGRLPTNRNDVPTWFKADRTQHSAKPESFYDLVESCSPGPWFEMFARRRRLGDWHVWGNEA